VSGPPAYMAHSLVEYVNEDGNKHRDNRVDLLRLPRIDFSSLSSLFRDGITIYSAH
jgi:hypothetical protein